VLVYYSFKSEHGSAHRIIVSISDVWGRKGRGKMHLRI